MEKSKKKLSQAMLFIILFGIVSLFSDMTHEGASSIRGAYLSLLGASAAAIGFISGLGELIGYSMRYVFGKLTDKTKTKTTSNCKFFLCEPCMLAFSFDELSDCIIHTTILHPIGYKIKACNHNYTRLGIKSTTRTIQSILGKVIL